MKASSIENDMQCLYCSSLNNAVTATWQTAVERRPLQGAAGYNQEGKCQTVPGSSVSKPALNCAASLEVNSKENKQLEKLRCLVEQRRKLIMEKL